MLSEWLFLRTTDIFLEPLFNNNIPQFWICLAGFENQAFSLA